MPETRVRPCGAASQGMRPQKRTGNLALWWVGVNRDAAKVGRVPAAAAI